MTIYALIEVSDDAMAVEDDKRTRQMKTRQIKTWRMIADEMMDNANAEGDCKS